MSLSSNEIFEVAVKHGARWPGLVVAQWRVESGGGLYLAAKNNLFGLKGGSSKAWTKEHENGKIVDRLESFLEFESQEDCVKYLIDKWYKDYRNHKGVNNCNSAEEAARMLQSEGYATDTQYASLLIKNMASVPELADILDVINYYRGEAHQKEALLGLWSGLSLKQRQDFTRAWRRDAPAGTKFPLPVPYSYQSDSKTWQGQRMCQSSSIAMRVKRIAPELIKDDDDYLAIVNRFGDTVSQEAHRKALAHLGLKAQFKTTGSEAELCRLLDDGEDIPIGVLHRGTNTSPTGGGHWLDVIGHDKTHFWVHDPFGEMDLVRGGFVATGPDDGRNQRYSKLNLMRRWLIRSKSDGWMWIIRK